MMFFVPEDLLASLLAATPRLTAEAPRNARGLYGLVDHEGQLRYIGSTSSLDQTLYERIHQRHRTGSEGMSHYFSQMYNTGRMWRDRKDAATKADGDIAKKLRNAFIADHCRAVWIALPDTADIGRLEAEVIALAPDDAIAWNRRGMAVYDEPADLVEATLHRLSWGASELAALERQRQRCLGGVIETSMTGARQPSPALPASVLSFPKGPFRFFALDVETANNDRGSICQIGVACVRPDNSIETWVTYVDPQTDVWIWSGLHGITAHTVRGAPTFSAVLPVLCEALEGHIVYQHSGFDRSAVAAACGHANLPIPDWNWLDSVRVARVAWPELRGNGGHGLASLKQHLGLVFEHHDAGEDARAAAEVVLMAEGALPMTSQAFVRADRTETVGENDFDLIEDYNESEPCELVMTVASTTVLRLANDQSLPRPIGTIEITQGNIDNHHIYLRSFFERFPTDAVGGSNRASAALREISVDWGGDAVAVTDLDGKKKFFRSRGWIRTFFERNGIKAGDMVSIEEVAPYSYRVSCLRHAG